MAASRLEIVLNPINLWRGSGVCRLSLPAKREPPGINQRQ